MGARESRAGLFADACLAFFVRQLLKAAAAALKFCLEDNIRPSDILTQGAFDNAFITDMAMGGSTNTVLETLALANASGFSGGTSTA